MKRICFALLAMGTPAAHAQPVPDARLLYQQGAAYLQGVYKSYDPAKAGCLLTKAAGMGYPAAMHLLAGMYRDGKGVPVNGDSARYWYEAAMTRGHLRAFSGLGQLYAQGKGVPQDFSLAANCYRQGAARGDGDCKNLLGYSFYKGLGVGQDYRRAFALFGEAAQTGNANAMYFLGLCYRNGYGTVADTVLAAQWLHKAAKYGDKQAGYERAEPLPENISTLSPVLQERVRALQQYEEKFSATGNNDFAGNYEGYAIYYDWSGRYVSEIALLQLRLTKAGDGYTAVWAEGNTTPATVTLQQRGNRFFFDENSHYTRRNHYSHGQPEQWQFSEAGLRLSFAAGAVQLSGGVQFYSAARREPGKPLQVMLSKTVVPGSNPPQEALALSVLPNPAAEAATVAFVLPQAASVAISLTGANGYTCFTEKPRLLPAGRYSYPLTTGHLPPGVYAVQLIINGKKSTPVPLVKL